MKVASFAFSSLIALCITGIPMASCARPPVKPLMYFAMMEQADLVVIAKPRPSGKRTESDRWLLDTTTFEGSIIKDKHPGSRPIRSRGKPTVIVFEAQRMGDLFGHGDSGRPYRG